MVNYAKIHALGITEWYSFLAPHFLESYVVYQHQHLGLHYE